MFQLMNSEREGIFFMKNRVKCNAELENDAEFCSECGQKIINSNSSSNFSAVNEVSANNFSELAK